LKKTQNIIDLIGSIFTSNIFVSLQSSLVLQIILFSVLVGRAAGFLSGSQKESFGALIAACDSIFKIIIGWITNFLPIGIICIFSIKLLNLSIEIFEIFLTSISCVIGSMLFIIFTMNLFIAKRLKVGYFSVFSKMKNVMMISASTGSTIATMPTYMNTLITEFGIDHNKIDLYIPLSIALFRFGTVYYFGFVAVLTAQIFSIPLGIYEYMNITLLVFFAGFAAVSSGIVNIGLLTMILSSVGVPSSFAITLFSAIDPIIDSVRSIFTMYMHLFCASFSFVEKKDKILKM
jgi:proton glutamate symport protein